MSHHDLAQPVNGARALSIEAPSSDHAVEKGISPEDEDLAKQWKAAALKGKLGVDFGIFTFMAMHWKSSGSLPGGRYGGAFVIITGCFVLFAQITLPIMYAEYQYEHVNQGWCVGDAN